MYLIENALNKRYMLPFKTYFLSESFDHFDCIGVIEN